MNSYTFRIVADVEGDVFRDIEIYPNDTFEVLHKNILKAFEFKGDQMASFYISNDTWEKGEEISLIDMGIGKSMSETNLKDIITDKHQKLLYVYDFLKMNIFYVELVKINKKNTTKEIPSITLIIGDLSQKDNVTIDYTSDLSKLDELEKLDSELENMNKMFSDTDLFGGDNSDDDDFFGEFENIDDLDI